MNRTISLRIDNSTAEERDFFELISSEPIPEIASALNTKLSNAKDTVCAVLSDVLPSYVNALARAKCSKYLIVSDIRNNALAPLKSKAIVRETRWSGFNIFIADGECAIIASGGCGIVIEDKDLVAKLLAHFRKWFWNETDFELIDAVSGVDSGVFDVLPVESDGKVATDSDNGISIITQSCDSVSFEGRYHQIFDDKALYFRTIPEISILKIRKKDSFYVPDLWIQFCEVAGDKYILNYNPASYPTMSEKGSSKLMGIRIGNLEMGAKYKYCQKESYAKLVGKKLKDSKGNDIEVLPYAKKNASITLLLKDYLFFKKLESENAQMLEERIRSRNPDLLVTSDRACSIEFIIGIDIQKHSPKAVKDPIYQEYSNMLRNLSQKRDEVAKLADKEKMDELSARIKGIQLPNSIADVAVYNGLVKFLNECIDEFNSRGGEIDEFLAEVSSSKKAAKIKTISRLKESEAKPLPRYGTLYKNGTACEYVLTDEKYVPEAEKEADERGWNNIAYYLERCYEGIYY
jgi:hypothetical protein